MRCKENFQGDRCKKEANHQLSVAENPDPQHQGSFTIWEGEGDSKKVLAKAQGAIPCIRRDGLRKAKKLEWYAQSGRVSAKQAIEIMDFVVKGLTRGK
jgi:hypothetical protein